MKHARRTVLHNGVKIHDNVEIPVNNTRAGLGGDVCQPGPIMLQDHHSPVQYRNLWLLRKGVPVFLLSPLGERGRTLTVPAHR